MTKKYATKQFNQFLPMIEKAVWHYHKKYHLEREDIEGQTYIVFCEALKTFDKSLGSFSTHLTNELQRLEFYCKMEFRKNNKDVQRIKSNGRGYGRNIYINRIDIPDTLHYDIFDKVITKMDYEISLSQDAKEIVQYICSREWETDLDKNWKPRFSYIQKLYLTKGWTRNRINVAWKQIREWWVGSNKDQFCLEV
jgi:DNA-directed RNA polymerase specialized sigma subunit